MKERETIELNLIDDNPWQPRTEIEPEALQQLADSIEQLGLLQAPLARHHPEVSGRYQLAFGHRRVAAVRLLRENGKWPVYISMDVGGISDEQMALLALTENQERKQLTQIEVLRAQKRAIDETELSIQDLAEKLGIGRSTLSNNLRVLELPGCVLEHVEQGDLTVGVAKEFLVLQSPTHAHIEDMRTVVRRIASVAPDGSVDLRPDNNRDRAPADWRRRTVRRIISEAVSYNEKDWRPIGASTGYRTGGGHKAATFDVDAFAHEYADALHTIPGTTATHEWGGEDPAYEKSRVWTCEVREWSRQQSRATREANKEAPASGGATAQNNAAADRDSQLGDVLKKDPVFQEIKRGRLEKGPNRPTSDEEKAALGTRAELITVTPLRASVLEGTHRPERHTIGRKMSNGGHLPRRGSPNLEECHVLHHRRRLRRSSREVPAAQAGAGVHQQGTLPGKAAEAYRDSAGVGEDGRRIRDDMAHSEVDIRPGAARHRPGIRRADTSRGAGGGEPRNSRR